MKKNIVLSRLKSRCLAEEEGGGPGGGPGERRQLKQAQGYTCDSPRFPLVYAFNSVVLVIRQYFFHLISTLAQKYTTKNIAAICAYLNNN